MNLPKAIRAKAHVEDLISARAGSVLCWVEKVRNVACMVVSPYTGSTRVVKASLIVFVASKT
jgi:hypothetical protein